MERLKRSPQGMSEWVYRREHVGRARRVKVSIPVKLELGPDRIVKAIIEDLSKDGFRLRSGTVLYKGQSLKMHLPRQTVACELRWIDGMQAGGMFADASDAPAW